uniref:Alpha-N-acetylgalactosaminide alpha-2,6-sialyltransferase 6-like n=1 Tax=Saccoglossus kowalevskii TaxID=10224 RepID=A0ABM0MQJ5_SACKO
MLFNISCKMATVRVFCAGFVLCQVAITFAIYLYVFMGSNDGQHIYGSTSIVASGLSTGVSGAITGKVRRNHTIGAPLIDFIVQEADTPHHGNVSNNIDLFKGTLQEDPWGYVSVERNKTLDFHCNACAVITASGHLLGKAAGAEIDSFQCVIRMNDHPTEKFSADVGKKTTARIISHASIKNQIRAQSNNLFQGVSKPNFNIFWGKGPALHIDIIRKLQSTYPLVKMYVTNVTQYEFGENVFRRETGLD